MSLVSGIGSHKLERYGADFLQVLVGDTPAASGAEEASRDAQALAMAGMSVEQISRQLSLSVKQVYVQLAQAISIGNLALHQAVDLPSGQLERIQDAFLNEAEEDLPGVRTVARELEEPVEEGVLHCIRAALIHEIAGA
jgi:ATP-dependent DNA helicase RecQ